MNQLHQAITALLSGQALTAAKNATIDHALTQWNKGQKTPVFQTLIALDCVEGGIVTTDKPKGTADRTQSREYMQGGKKPQSKGLTLERIIEMACHVAHVPALVTLSELIAAIESGIAPSDAASQFAELHKVNKAEHKALKTSETIASRSEKQTLSIAQKAEKAKVEKAKKALGEALELVINAAKANTLGMADTANLKAALADTSPIDNAAPV